MRTKIPQSHTEVPETLEKLLGFSTSCPCGRTHSVETVCADIRSGATGDLVEIARKIGDRLKTVVISDAVTDQVAGTDVQKTLRKAGFSVANCLVPDAPDGRPHADEKALDWVSSALEGADIAIAVGAGTINDLAKLASFQKKIPYVVVATAPSMNGYTSAIAAISVRGVKRTIPCHQPIGVIADLDILRSAPQHLICAGLGDLESKPTSSADFRLSGMVRATYYCKTPERVVFAAEERAAQAAPGLQQGDPDAIAALTEALILSGISMKLAGSSSPASGGEHLISHLWDMTAAEQGRTEGWHGSQVGVCTLVTSALYEYLAQIDPAKIDVEQLCASRLPRDQQERAIRQRHGARGDEVVAEFFEKQLDDEAFRTELTAICTNWQSLWEGLQEILRPSQQIRETLKAAGCPTTMAELGLGPQHMEFAFLAAREIRARYTVLDFAADLGMLESSRDQVLRRCAVLE
jgi:glycerol-1-phosphate dehydrogenase [NAD(P)+]